MKIHKLKKRKIYTIVYESVSEIARKIKITTELQHKYRKHTRNESSLKTFQTHCSSNKHCNRISYIKNT